MNIGYIFPGQGSQFIGMGADFYNSSTLAKEMFDVASEVLKKDFKKLLLEENDELNQTEFSQPAILLVSTIAHKLFNQNKATLALGHSLGEFSALVSVSALDFEDAIKLVHKRGLLMKKACEKQNAGMLAVIGIEIEKLSSLCEAFQANGKKIYLANINNKTQIVLAGIKSDLSSVENILKENGARRVLLLPMSVASHCPILNPITDEFKELLKNFLKDNFLSPLISNVTAKDYSDKQTAIELLTKQLVSPVQYVKSIQLAEKRCDCFVEFGSTVLRGLNKKISTKETKSIVDFKTLENTISELV